MFSIEVMAQNCPKPHITIQNHPQQYQPNKTNQQKHPVLLKTNKLQTLPKTTTTKNKSKTHKNNPKPTQANQNPPTTTHTQPKLPITIQNHPNPTKSSEN